MYSAFVNSVSSKISNWVQHLQTFINTVLGSQPRAASRGRSVGFRGIQAWCLFPTHPLDSPVNLSTSPNNVYLSIFICAVGLLSSVSGTGGRNRMRAEYLAHCLVRIETLKDASSYYD